MTNPAGAVIPTFEHGGFVLSQAPANPTANAAKPNAPASPGMYEVARPRGQCVVCQTQIPAGQPLNQVSAA